MDNPPLIFGCQLFRKRTVKPSKAYENPIRSTEEHDTRGIPPLFDRSPENALVAPSRLELERKQKRLLTEIRDSLAATITLAVAGVLAIALLEAWALPDTTILGLQEIVGVIVFASCTWFMYERGENKLHLYAFEPANQTMTGEIRALLNRLPDGVAYQQAIDAEQRAYTTGELEEIRARVRAFGPAE